MFDMNGEVLCTIQVITSGYEIGKLYWETLVTTRRYGAVGRVIFTCGYSTALAIMRENEEIRIN